jgi:DNA-binding beta-propeller fold protein YncE
VSSRGAQRRRIFSKLARFFAAYAEDDHRKEVRELKLVALLPVAFLALVLVSGSVHADEPAITVVSAVPLAGQASGQVLSFDESARHLYIGMAEGVMVADAVGQKLGFLNVPGPRALVLADPLRMGFLAGGADNSVTVFDPASLKVMRSVETGLARIDAMALDPRTSRLFVASGSAVDVLDATTLAKADHLDLASAVSAMTGDGAGRIFASLPDKGEIAVIDAKGDTLRDSFSTGQDCQQPGALLLDDIHKHLFVACEGGAVVMIDSDYGAIEGSVPAASTVQAMAFDSGLDRVYAVTQPGDILDIGPGDHGYAVLAHFPGLGGAGLALDAAGHRLYTLRPGDSDASTLSILSLAGSQ